MSISLAIYGAKEDAGGWEPQYILNTPRPTVEDKDGSELQFEEKNLQHYYEITISECDVQYTIVHNEVKAFDASRIGRLKIAIQIPRGYRPANNISPYDILKEMNDLHWEKNMNASERRFNNLLVDGDVFVQALNKYALEKHIGSYRVMAGQIPAHIVLDEQQVRDLFTDVHYQEFRNYKKIIVAKSPETTGSYRINGLQVPRPMCIPIKVNDVFYKTVNTDEFEDQITINTLNVLNLPSDSYEPSILKFSISDLLKGENYKYVRFDAENECVICTPAIVEKSRLIHIRTNIALPNLNILRIFCNGMPAAIDNGCIVLKGRQINNPEFSIQTTHYAYSLINHGIHDDELYVELSVNQQMQAEYNSSPQITIKISNLNEVDKNRREFSLVITCLQNNATKKLKDYDLRHSTTVSLDPSWRNKDISIVGENKYYTLELGTPMMRVEPIGCSSAILYAKRRPFRVIYKKQLTIFVCLLLLTAAVFGFTKLMNGVWMRHDPINDCIESLKTELNKEDLSFEYITTTAETLLNQIDTHRQNNEKSCVTDQSIDSVKQKVSEYRKIIDFFKKESPDDAAIRDKIKMMKSNVNNYNYILQSVKDNLKNGLENNADYVGLVLKDKEENKLFDSFDDLQDLSEGKPQREKFVFKKPKNTEKHPKDVQKDKGGSKGGKDGKENKKPESEGAMEL